MNLLVNSESNSLLSEDSDFHNIKAVSPAHIQCATFKSTMQSIRTAENKTVSN